MAYYYPNTSTFQHGRSSPRLRRGRRDLATPLPQHVARRSQSALPAAQHVPVHAHLHLGHRLQVIRRVPQGGLRHVPALPRASRRSTSNGWQTLSQLHGAVH